MLNLLNAIAAGSAIFLAFLVITVRRDANVAANQSCYDSAGNLKALSNISVFLLVEPSNDQKLSSEILSISPNQ